MRDQASGAGYVLTAVQLVCRTICHKRVGGRPRPVTPQPATGPIVDIALTSEPE